MRMVRFVVLCVLTFPAWAAPEPVRDTTYDWRCEGVSDHQRMDKAIHACQEAAESNPGQTFYFYSGKYRVTVPVPDDGIPNIETGQPFTTCPEEGC